MVHIDGLDWDALTPTCAGCGAKSGRLENGQCPIEAACLAYAVAMDEDWGVWGGLTVSERKSLRRAS